MYKGYTKLGYDNLLFIFFSVVVGYSEWVGDYKLNLIADEKTLATFNKQHSLWMLNHRYQVDWIALQMIGNYYGMIQVHFYFLLIKCFDNK